MNTYSKFKNIHYLRFVGRRQIVLLFIPVLFVFSCKKEPVPYEYSEGNKVVLYTVPKGFPYPTVPVDNLPTKNRIVLGKRLFFDPVLSRDSTISCGSCHLEDKYFTDNLKVSEGIGKQLGVRNAPTIINVAYHPYFFWDGGNPTLEQQVVGPIENSLEMGFNINEAVARLKKHSDYVKLFQEAYGKEISPFTLTRAIACYERTIISGNSRYDDYIQKGDTSALTTSEKNGMNIFFGEKGECFHCHGGFNFTDNSFANNGLYTTYADSGRARITLKASDVGKFKTPSLRNIDNTAPYMHDGSFATLVEVVEHYNSGGKKHPNKSPILLPLKLTVTQKQDLVNFLKSLTDK